MESPFDNVDYQTSSVDNGYQFNDFDDFPLLADGMQQEKADQFPFQPPASVDWSHTPIFEANLPEGSYPQEYVTPREGFDRLTEEIQLLKRRNEENERLLVDIQTTINEWVPWFQQVTDGINRVHRGDRMRKPRTPSRKTSPSRLYGPKKGFASKRKE